MGNFVTFRKPRFSYFILYLFLGLLLLNIPQVINLSLKNIWSREFLRQVTRETENIYLRIQSPPTIHSRANLWLAELALNEGYFEKTQLLIDPLIEQGDKQALVILGKLEAQQGDFDGAVTTLFQSGSYQALNQLGKEAEDDNNLDNAVIAREAAWKLNPEEYAGKLSDILEDAGRIDDAKSMLIGMLNDFPTSIQRTQWLQKLGDLSYKQKLWKDAIEYYQRVIDKEEYNSQARIGLGRVYYELDDNPKRALSELNQALATGSNLGPVYFAIGNILASEGNFQEAEEFYAKATEKKPANRRWGLIRANNLRIAGHFRKASAQYEILINKYPNWANVYYEIAWLYKLENKPDEAIGAIEKSLILQAEGSIKGFIRAGKIYEWANMHDAALESYYQVLSISPDNQSAKEAIIRLSGSEY